LWRNRPRSSSGTRLRRQRIRRLRQITRSSPSPERLAADAIRPEEADEVEESRAYPLNYDSPAKSQFLASESILQTTEARRIVEGLAEIAAGSIAMGLGGYLATKSDAEHYRDEMRREGLEIVETAKVEKQEVVDLFKAYGVTAEECAPVLLALERKPDAWRDFMMRFELGLVEPAPKRAVIPLS
jgi:hypothetical protein